jgi:hypothetical protein
MILASSETFSGSGPQQVEASHATRNTAAARRELIITPPNYVLSSDLIEILAGESKYRETSVACGMAMGEPSI